MITVDAVRNKKYATSPLVNRKENSQDANNVDFDQNHTIKTMPSPSDLNSVDKLSINGICCEGDASVCNTRIQSTANNGKQQFENRYFLNFISLFVVFVVCKICV